MKRLLPSPWLSLGLFGGWLLLTRSFSLGQALLGLLAAVVVPLLMAPLRPRPGPLRRARVLVRLVARVGGRRGAFGLAGGPRRAAGAHAAAARRLRGGAAGAARRARAGPLAVISAVVPGTVWCELAPDRSALRMHVFDLDDEAAFIAHFKTDYEQPLKEIFE